MKSRTPRLRSTLLATALAVGSLAPLAGPAMAANETVTVTVKPAGAAAFPPAAGIDGLVVRAIKVDASGAQVGSSVPTMGVPIIAPGGGEYTLTLSPGSWKIEAADTTRGTGARTEATQYARVWSGQANSFAQATAISIDGVGTTAVPLEMSQGGSLSVQTQSDVGNELINNICATVYDAATSFPVASIANAGASTVTVRSLLPGNYKVELAAPAFIDGDCSGASQAYTPEFYENQTTLNTAIPVAVVDGGNNTVIASLAPAVTNRTITGTVRAPGGGTLQAIKVTAIAVGGGAVGKNTTTNSSGGYTLNLTSGTYKILFEDFDTSDGVNYASECWNNKPACTDTIGDIVDVSTASKSGIDASLDVSGSISGTVTKADGPDEGTAADPVDQATVQLYDANNALVRTASTNTSGAYTLTGLFPATYKMKITPTVETDLTAEWYLNKSDFASATGISLSSGQVRTGINTLLDASATIAGTVTGPASAKLAGICVAAYTPGGTFSGVTATTDVDGNYTLTGLGLGDYKLRFSDGDDRNCGPLDITTLDYASKWYSNGVNFETATAVTLSSAGLTGRNITLVDGALNLSGTATKSGGAAAQVCVRVYDSSNRILRERATDAAGFWRVGGLAPGTVRVEYRPDLASGDNCYATDADKLGGTGASADSVTDQGPPTAGGVGLANRFHLDKLTLADATPRNMVVDQSTTGVDQFLPTVGGSTNTGSASITGTITEPPASGNTNVPVEGACAAAVPLNWDGTEAAVTSKSAQTTSTGVYTISNLAADTLFKIRFSNDPALCTANSTGFNATQWYVAKDSFSAGNAVRTNANSSAKTGINATLAYAGVISGVISNAELGGGVQSNVMVYKAEDGTVVRTVKTAANGTYKAGSLPLGNYKVGVEPLDANYRPVFHTNSQNIAGATVVVINNSTTANVSVALDRNHAPVPADDSVTVEVNTPKILTGLTSNDVDEDGDVLAISAVGTPTSGTAVLNDDGTVTYTPAQDNQDQATFTYTVKDPGGLSASATVTVTMTGEIVGIPPIAGDDEVVTARNTSVAISVLTNDNDPDGDNAALVISAVGTPFHGVAAISGTKVNYTPDNNFTGVDQFTYSITDTQGYTDTGKITVNVASSSDNAVSTTVAAGGTVGTNGAAADANNVIITTVTSPNAGAVTIEETQSAKTTANGLTIIAPRVAITAPAATAAKPLTITFRLDGSVLQGLQPQRAIRVFRNGTVIGDCLGSAVATPNPCLAGHQRIGDDLLLTIRTSNASQWTFGFLDEAVVDRASGSGRVITAVEIAREAFSPSEVTTVVIARADTFPDALAGAPLAHQLGGPLLLTTSSALDVATRDEILRLGPNRVVILGGTSAVSAGVENTLRNLAGVQTVERISGKDRFETAAQVAARLDPFTSAYVVEGQNADLGRGWPDAVSVASLAAYQGRPILLVTKDVLPSATRNALNGLTSATIIGGTGAVSAAVATAIDQVVGSVGRISGSSRYETNYQVVLAARNAGMSASSIWIATGTNFPDALAAGAAVAKEGGLLLLVDGGNYAASPRVGQFLSTFRNQIESVTITGGTGAVSAAVEAGIRQDVAT